MTFDQILQKFRYTSFSEKDKGYRFERLECKCYQESTTIKGFNREAEATIKDQTPQVGRLGYFDLYKAPVDWLKLDEGLSCKNAAVKKYDLKPHQQTAISAVHDYLKTNI